MLINQGKMTSRIYYFTSDNLFHNDCHPLMEVASWTNCDDDTILNDVVNNFGKYFECGIECATDPSNNTFGFLSFQTSNGITREEFVEKVGEYYKQKGLQQLIDDLDGPNGNFENDYAFVRAGDLDKLIDIIKTCAGKDHYVVFN